jgi:hypothetical protein
MRKKIVGIFVITLFIATTISVIGEIPPSKAEIKTKKNYLKSNEPSITPVYTNQFIYQVSQTIFITFINSEPDSVEFGGPPMFQIYRFTFAGFQWKYIYPDTMGLVLFILDPGKSRTETWDQKNSSGIQVPRGFYRVDIPYYSNYYATNKVVRDYFLIL